jgi:hypothetical protein
VRRRPAHPAPAATLLRRLGWRHLEVTCRDRDGQRTALHLRRRIPTIEVKLPGGHLARLTNIEAGQLRAALREVLLGDHQPHRADAA